MARTVYDKLKMLQEVLSQKFEVEREILEIPKSLATKTELLNRVKKGCAEKTAAYEGAKAKIIELTQMLTEAEQSREKYEGQMDLIKTQREYEALDKEIKEATEKEQSLRKELQREQTLEQELSVAIEKEEMMIKKQEEDVKEEQSKIKIKIKEKNQDNPGDRRGNSFQIREDHQEQIRRRYRISFQGRMHGMLHDSASAIREYGTSRRESGILPLLQQDSLLFGRG
jgi:predicted  nucleic acid-binding Zn-ribbon protein